MYTYRKPKDAKEAIKLVETAGVNVSWDICVPKQIDQSQVYFNHYKPRSFDFGNYY